MIKVFSALTEQVDYIVTRNAKDFTNSKIPVLSPTQFLYRISKS